MSVPDGVERTRERWEMVASVLQRYMGSQLRRVCKEGKGDESGVCTGLAFSGVVSGGGRRWISDISDDDISQEMRRKLSKIKNDG